MQLRGVRGRGGGLVRGPRGLVNVSNVWSLQEADIQILRRKLLKERKRVDGREMTEEELQELEEAVKSVLCSSIPALMFMELLPGGPA